MRSSMINCRMALFCLNNKTGVIITAMAAINVPHT